MFPGLTQRKAENLTTPGEFRAGGVPGLFLLVRDGKLGLRKTWILRMTIRKKVLRRGLGLLCDVPMEQARAKAASYRQSLLQGKDPLVEKKEALRALPRPCAQLIKAWDESQRRRAVHKEEADYQADARVLREAFQAKGVDGQELGRKLPEKITSPDIAALLNDLAEHYTGKVSRTRYLMGSFLSWCRSMGWMDSGALPTSKELLGPLLTKRRVKKNVQPGLPYREIPHLMDRLVSEGSPISLALAFSILTATRSANVRTARWREISADGTTWTISSGKMKISENGGLRVPLSQQAQAILRRIRGTQEKHGEDLLFEKERAFPLQGSDFRRQLIKMDEADLAAGGKGFRDPLQLDKDGLPRLITQHGTARSGFRTWSEDTKIAAPCVLEAALHHRTEAYKRTDYLTERVQVMQRWGSFCLPNLS